MRALVIGGLVIFAMSAAADVFKPVALAVLLTFLLAPMTAKLEHLGLPRVLSVALVLILLLAVIGGVVYVVGGQFASLAEHIPDYQEKIRAKLTRLKPSGGSAFDRVYDAVSNFEASNRSEEEIKATPVRIVSGNDILGTLHAFLGPFESIVAMGGIVLLLVVFLLFERDDIGDRIIQLVGWGRIGVTTKTLAQIGSGLSSYLTALSLVNAGFGLVIGLGLWAIGLPSPALWGFLAAMFRFIPYVGTVLSFSFPALISVAHFPGWTQLALVFALFATVELVVNGVEPLLYGKSTGISPIGLLIAAMFWTWLWGGLGLLLANALTVCLAVAGRSIPGLGFLGALLSHDVAVADDLRWYQRVLNRDQDGSLALLEEALKTRSFEEVCDQIVIPTLARAEQDRSQEFIEGRDVAFIWRLVREWLDDVADNDEMVLTAPTPSMPAADQVDPLRTLGPIDAEQHPFVGIATGGGADSLVLRMLNMALKPSGVRLTILSAGASSLQLSEKIASLDPGMVLISHLPPEGLTRARYLTKRIRARHGDVPIVFGYWDLSAEPSRVVEQLRPATANRIVVSVAAARAAIVHRAAPPVLAGSTHG
ncbi:MAG: AI-2E family transporter [Paludisphaera borealis]|uniref:AI-2E family transporter n=1 Tax=Paludisphaera borealis TaxID=1387353 RepID=UPI00284B4C4E|nr:AI-2E family transporter [Paludisphaera borealis]MDR3622661.1 AI-2E family transporter [Paludisphaera borealis]